MICIYSDIHKKHHPPFEVFNGDHDTAQEVPGRIDTIKASLKNAGLNLVKSTSKVSRRFLESIHDKYYLDYLENTSKGLRGREYAYPSIHSYSHMVSHSPKKLSPIALRGTYAFDTYTPILASTYEVAVASSSIAYEASQKLLDNPKEIYYALCRPPGHHAEHAMAGGYCYINNSAVAAQRLSREGKTAVLDIDFHHGNGTQGIFYERSDVLTVSIHADPRAKFPFFTGFADEIGIGQGLGYNLNIPLPLGTDESRYSVALDTALHKIQKFEADYLVLAFGADTHVKDPIGGFRLTTKYYENVARKIKSLGMPLMIVQEGGYNSSILGQIVVSLLSGF